MIHNAFLFSKPWRVKDSPRGGAEKAILIRIQRLHRAGRAPVRNLRTGVIDSKARSRSNGHVSLGCDALQRAINLIGKIDLCCNHAVSLPTASRNFNRVFRGACARPR